MRLTTVIILSAMLQVSASSFAQRINYVQNDATLAQLFKEIKKQTGYNVVWNEKKLNAAMTIQANFIDAPVEKVLDQVLSRLPVSYTLRGKAIIIKKEEPSLIDNIISSFQAIDVRGTVVDDQGVPLMGATVKVKGTNRSTQTNSEGNFSLIGVAENAALVITYLGFQVKEITAATNLGKIILESTSGDLKEVEINAGYYTVKERERTGSISRISSVDIEKQPVNNVLQAMQANMPGVQITQTTGISGGGFNVQIRGRNSISQGNNPFYIVDGVPFTASSIAMYGPTSINPDPSPLASINPSDIESIEVLKDADATAIYGSRGANGVILITTKNGSTGSNKVTISLNQGISRVAKKLDLLNTAQYLDMRREAYFTNDKLTTTSSTYATQYDINGTWGDSRDIDWQKEFIGGVAPTTNIYTSLSGGTEYASYILGGSYLKEGTVFPGEFSYGRGAGNFGLKYGSKDKKINIQFSTNYSKINSKLFNSDLTQYILLLPNYPELLDEKGALNWANNTVLNNPYAFNRRVNDATTNNLISNAVFSYKIISDLEIKTSIGYTNMSVKDYQNQPLSTINTTSSQYDVANRRAFFGNNNIETWILEPQLNWKKRIFKGQFNLLVGATFQENLTDGQRVRGSGYTSDALLGNIAAASTFTVDSRQYAQYRYMAIFSRLNYTFNDKYIFNVTGRRDGSTRFGNENRFANFGALGGAWIISSEKFFKEISFVSFAKLRGSYGITGNDQISDYSYLELWGPFSSTYQGNSTILPSQIANPTYAWEINRKVELGLDVGFFKDRVTLSAGFYSNRSSNQLVGKSLPISTGFISIQDNLPAKVSNVGYELEFNTKNISREKFYWSTSFNLTIPKNKLLSYPDLAQSSNATSYAVGSPLSILKLYNTPVDPLTGLYTIEDYDRSGAIEPAKDRYIIEFIGRKYYGGIQNSFSYKGIQLDFLFQFVKQDGTGYLSQFSRPGDFTFIGNQAVEVLGNWKQENDIAKIQKFTTLSSSGFNNARSNGILSVEDASFIRLKNTSISYSLQSDFLRKYRVNGFKIFLQGQNLFTITHYRGLDPETQTIARLPSLQVFSGGLQIVL